MIRDRNIAPNAAINPSKIAGGMGYGVRDIHYLCDSDETVMYKWLGAKVPGEKLHRNLSDAVSAATAGDLIQVYPGDYDRDTAVVTIPAAKRGLKIVGVQGPTRAGYGCFIRGATGGPPVTGGFNILQIDADDVEIANLAFYVGRGTNSTPGLEATYYGIDVAGGNSTNPGGVWIHDCAFYCGYTNQGTGVYFGNREVSLMGDAMDGTVENCYFHKLAIGLRMDASRMLVRNNHFIIDGNSNQVGIGLRVNAAERPDSVIEWNTFTASPVGGGGSDGYGIYMYATPTAGALVIDQNQFVNFASATRATTKITTALDYYQGRNWMANTAL